MDVVVIFELHILHTAVHFLLQTLKTMQICTAQLYTTVKGLCSSGTLEG